MKKMSQRITKTQVWRSVFRHGLNDTTRNRVLSVVSNVILHLHPIKIPASRGKVGYTFCLGGLTFFMFLIEIVTGTLLMFYYRPTPEYAYVDMQLMENTVMFGVILRNLHRWAAHAMVVLVMLHMLRVFMTGSYRPPREFNWVVGVILLVFTLLLSFTGYLLPWDQLAYWAITVGTNMAAATPFLGSEGPFSDVTGITPHNDVRYLLLGDTAVGSNALLRFYVFHCVLLPVGASALMAVHFWRVRKDGGISRPL